MESWMDIRLLMETEIVRKHTASVAGSFFGYRDVSLQIQESRAIWSQVASGRNMAIERLAGYTKLVA